MPRSVSSASRGSWRPIMVLSFRIVIKGAALRGNVGEETLPTPWYLAAKH